MTIMEIVFMMSKIFELSWEVVEAINRCRLYTMSLFLSDVANAAGNRIDYNRCGEACEYLGTSNYRFPTTRPSASDWQHWRQFWVLGDLLPA